MKAGSWMVAIALVVMLSTSALAQDNSTATTPSDSAATATDAPDTSQPDAHVRAVRLSQISGTVEVDRNMGVGFEPALLNLPMVEGFKLRTGAGFAEVEFEDGSTLRLTPSTAVAFDQLQRKPSGGTVTAVHLDAGTVYVSMARTKGNEFTLSFAKQKAQLMPSSHVRLYLTGEWASLSMLHGKATVNTPSTVTTVSKRTANFHLLGTVAASENKNATAPYDGWDEEAIDYHDYYAKAKAYGNPGVAYGIADMNYYGSFANLGGCGVVWRPYFANSVWDPFANGSWVLYPSWGYAWVSPYPWGWTAFHYGRWEFCPGFGWGWQPYGREFRTQPVVPKPPHGYSIPKPPPRPRPRESQVVAVNRTPAVKSQVLPGQAVFVRGSAGLGVPRGNFPLSGFSKQAEQQGSARAGVWSSPLAVSSGQGSFAHLPGGIPGKAEGKSGGYSSGSPSYFGRPGSYSSGHSGYSGGSSGGGYSGGHSGGGYSGGGGSAGGGGHSSGGSGGSFGGGGGGGGGGHGGR